MATEKQLKYWATLKGKKPNIPSRKGIPSWNKGLHVSTNDNFYKGNDLGKVNKGRKISKEQKKQISLANKGRKLSSHHIKRIIVSNTGKKRSLEFITRISGEGNPMWGKINVAMLGDKNHNWKGGITHINKKIRESFDYEEWRTKVFQRDDYTCQHCGQIGGYLQADHIKPFAFFLELRFDVSNGRTLCLKCHRKTDTWGARVFKSVESVG
ncbi:MAG: HNH endonuclease [Gallionella sp.]|jgi:hypothetical protein|nr:HNH endonuclease [Gallionella sp.]